MSKDSSSKAELQIVQFYFVGKIALIDAQNSYLLRVIKRGLLDFKYRPTILFYNVLNPKGSQWMAEYLVANQMSVLESANLDEYLDAMTSTWYSQDRLQQVNLHI